MKQVNIPNTSTAVELYIFDCAGQSIFNQIEANSSVSAAVAIGAILRLVWFESGSRRVCEALECVRWSVFWRAYVLAVASTLDLSIVSRIGFLLETVHQ